MTRGRRTLGALGLAAGLGLGVALLVFAATATKTWTFLTDSEGLSDATVNVVTFAHEPADGSPGGCVKYTSTAKNQTIQDFARNAATGETWETWGVLPGSTVTQVQITGWSERTVANTKLTSHSLSARIIDSTGAVVHSAGDLLAAVNPGTGVDATWQAGAAGTARAVDAAFQASSTDVRLELEYNIVTGGGSGSANVDQRFDQIQLAITYTPPSPCAHAQPTVTIVGTSAKTGCRGDALTYTFTVTNNCTGSCGSETFALGYADGAGGFTSSGPASVTLAPGATSANQTLTVTLGGAASGTDTTTITASLAGHTSGTNSTVQTTADTTPPASATVGCSAVSSSQIDLTFTNPETGVLVVRGPAGGACPTFAPAQGTPYATGVQGADTIVFAAAGTAFSDTGLTSSTAYCYEVWAYDACRNYQAAPGTSSCTTQGAACTHGQPTVTVSAPTSRSGCIGGAATFSFTVTNNCSGSCGNETFALGYGDSAANFTSSGPASVTLAPGATSAAQTLTVSLSAGAVGPNTTTLTASLAGHTSGTATATTTVDAAAPGGAVFTGCTGTSSSQIALAWTNPADPDFAGVLVVRGPAGGACPTFAPVQGSTYTPGPQGADTIVYASSGAVYTDAGLASNTAYCYEVWAHDACPNYVAAPGSTSCSTSSFSQPALTTGVPSASVDGCTQVTIRAPYTGDDDGDSTITVARGVALAGPFGTTVCSGATTASPHVCVDATAASGSSYYYQISFTDPDGVSGANPQVIGPYTTPVCGASGTTLVSNTAAASGCRQITVVSTFTGDGDGDGSTLVQVSPAGAGTWTTACGTLTGPSPRQCLVTELSPSTAYDIRVTLSDPDGVSGTNPQTLANITTPACGADQEPPMILPLSPTRGAVVGGTERVKVQLYDASALTSLTWAVDGGAATSFLGGLNANYACGTGCGVYEFDWNTTGLSNGPHALTFVAGDGSNTARTTWAVTVNNRGGKAAGSGTLLRRSHGSELCIDCHNLPTHSSQQTSGKYGNWALDCLACHTPHKTRNVYLVGEQIRTPNSGVKAVTFQDATTGLGFLGGTAGTYGDGVCEVCHTKTSHYRNDTSGGDHTHNQGASCTGCHKHGEGFKGAGCNGCHNAPPAQGSHAAHTVNAVPTAYGNAGANSTATEYGFACAKCHNATHVNDSHAGTAGDPLQVEVAGEASSPDTTAMTYQGVYAGANTEQGPDGRYWAWDNRSCASVYCHGNFPGGTAANTYTWGTSTAACGDCHGASPASPPSGGAHMRHLGQGHGFTNIDLKCYDCHQSMVDATPAVTDKTLHVNGGTNWDLRTENTRIKAGATYSGTEAGVKSPPSATYGDCTNVYCHSNGDPVNGTSLPYAVYQTINWTSPCTLCHTPPADPGCEGCHGFDTVAVSPTQIVIGENTARKGSLSHVKHVRTYGFMCHDCHSVTMLDRTANRRNLDPAQTTHVNAAKDVDFSTWPVDQTGGAWEGVNHTCTSTYCHSQGTSATAPFLAPNATADWDGAATTCQSCHGGNAAAASKMATNAHGAHMNQAAYLGTDLMCYRCHNGTVGSGSDTTITAVASHVNGSRDVSMVDGGTYAAWACTNAYCHSSGQAAAAPIQYYNPPNWNSGTLLANDCKACHGRHSDNAFVPVGGEPNYTNGGAGAVKANSHQRHVGAEADCAICHQNTTTNGTAIRAASTIHLDGSRDITWDAARTTAGATYTQASKTCGSTGSACHGAGSPQWGGTVTCRSCHMGSGAGDQDADDWVYGNGTIATIDGEDWRSYGHGRWGTDGNYQESGNAPANLDNNGARDGCLYCHTAGVAHNTVANPFRLANVGAADTVVLKNGVCTVCHGGAGYNPGSGLVDAPDDVDAYHYGTDHVAASDGGMFCWDCHDPHGDYNYASTQRLAYMIDETPTEDHSGSGGWGVPTTLASTPDFRNNRDGAAGWAYQDYVSNTLVGGTYRGVCQVCHDNTNHYRKATLYDGATHYNAGNPRCSASCHTHDQPPSDAFKPSGGGDCLGCHQNSTQGSRRAVGADFSKNSHHVGDGTANMGGALSNFDCVVCHAEGTVTAGATDTTAYHNDGAGAGGANRIDLRNVDSTTAVFSYDKDAVSASAGAAANWNSGNATWVTQTSANLDPFCLRCHDNNGASQIANFRENTTQTATNPFADTTITNEYDQADRTRVTDIATRVAAAWDNGPGGAYTATDRDSGYAPAGVTVRGADGRSDPPEGVFSRHAIRGQSVSVYGGTNGNLDSATYWNRSKVTWASNSVMGCADCHTVDGANTTNGNAHGSDSEYLLKNGSGGATEGNSATTYVCAQCHNSSNYLGGVHMGMSSNSGNCPTDSTGSTGTARVSSDGNIYGYFCGSCHGGGATSKAGATFPTGSTGAGGFGTIHGTSQVFGIVSATGTARPAYRFTNGNSMRYYNPGTWSGGSKTCYTIGTADSWGSCTQHSGGRSANSDLSTQRPLNY